MSKYAQTVIWAATVVATTAVAQSLLSIDDEIRAYEQAIAGADTTPRGVESAFAAVADLRQALFAPAPDGKLSVLEVLSEADFARLERLPGVFVQRLEVLVVHPDTGFFVALAARAGDPADRRFAAALAATYPDGTWPVYVGRQTDYSGCTTFGDGVVLEVYLAWSAMDRDFPGRYVSTVARERDAVVEAITGSTCACEDAASVVGDLERTAAALTATDPILPAVYERLAALDEGRSNIRFRCISG